MKIKAAEDLEKNPMVYKCGYCDEKMTNFDKILYHVGLKVNKSRKQKQIRVDCRGRRKDLSCGSTMKAASSPHPKKFPFITFKIRPGARPIPEQIKELTKKFIEYAPPQ